MLIDIIVFVLCLLALYKGLRRGLILAVFSLLSFIIGLAAALKLSAMVAVYLGNNINIAERWLPFLAFTLVFIIVVVLVRLGARAIEGAINMAMLGWLNKITGVLLYFFLYMIIFSVILFYAEQLNIIKKEAADNSFAYSYLLPLGPRVIGWVAVIIPLFENMFTQLKEFFGRISDK